MFGAVLWSDPSSERALIWCEDHADLAFFAADASRRPQLEPGDLVSFTLTTQRSLRFAEDVEVLATEEYPFLADGLQKVQPPALGSARAEATSNGMFASDCQGQNNVVPFILPDSGFEQAGGQHAEPPKSKSSRGKPARGQRSRAR
ncbi:MAG: hypothetical protein AAF686_04475 [Pseudomonadota bacterium]